MEYTKCPCDECKLNSDCRIQKYCGQYHNWLQDNQMMPMEGQ
jgi:hypothetical protein